MSEFDLNSTEKYVLSFFNTQSPVSDFWGVEIDSEHVNNYLRESRKRFELIINTVKNYHYNQGAKILEVGAAYGVSLICLKSFYHNLFATDIEESIGTYGIALKNANIPLLPWNIYDEVCPFDGQKFDVIIVSEVIEHLQLSINAVVNKLAYLLNPNGIIILTTPNLYCLPNLVRILQGRNICEAFQDAPVYRNGVVIDNRCHPREPTMNELKSACLINGLKVVGYGYFNTAIRSSLKSSIYQLVPNKYRDHCIVVAKK